jgi:peptidoglycan/LPS O-acetylase OafA/YrhL
MDHVSAVLAESVGSIRRPSPYGIARSFLESGHRGAVLSGLAFFVWKSSMNGLGKICAVGILIALLLRWWFMAHTTRALIDVTYMNTLTRMDALLAGGLCTIAIRNSALLERAQSYSCRSGGGCVGMTIAVYAAISKELGLPLRFSRNGQGL